MKKKNGKNLKVWVIVVVLCGLAFAIWFSAYRTEVRTRGLEKKSLAEARVAALNYYKAYTACSINPPTAALGMVDNYCQANNPYGTEGLVKILVQNGKIPFGVNPVTCAQNIVLNTTVEKTTGSIQGDTGSVTVVESFGEDNRVKIKVDLVKDGETWLVSNITCPSPEN